MLKFYYSPGSSALAAHILLEEVGADYQAIKVSIRHNEQKSGDFLARNPKGRIPLLETAEGVITENPAILEYIAAVHPSLYLIPTDDFGKAQARSLCAYLCATAHVAAAHRHRADRWASQDASLRDMQAQVPQNLRDCATFLDGNLALSPWAMGKTYSFCDPYLFQFYQWLAAADVGIAAYTNLHTHRERMLNRPATLAALSLHTP